MYKKLDFERQVSNRNISWLSNVWIQYWTDSLYFAMFKISSSLDLWKQFKSRLEWDKRSKYIYIYIFLDCFKFHFNKIGNVKENVSNLNPVSVTLIDTEVCSMFPSLFV